MPTRILAIETSDRRGSVAALEDDGLCQTVGSKELDATARTAQTLTPAIESLLAECCWKPSDLSLICVDAGPGSFTGLRIGVTAAKTLAYAIGADLAAVSSLAALASQVDMEQRKCCAIVSAQREELFSARFSSKEELLCRCDAASADVAILSADAWIAQLQPEQIAVGPPLAKLSERLPADVIAAPEDTWLPSAETVGRLGRHIQLAGQTVEPMQLVPSYIRRSAAEEKADRHSA